MGHKLTAAQLRELERLEKGPRQTLGCHTAKVQNNLVRLGLAEHVVFNEEEQGALLRALGFRANAFDRVVAAAMRQRISAALSTRVPPLRKPSTISPSQRGPRRSVTGRLAHRNGLNVLLLACGHVVTRRKKFAHTHCEACAACQPLEDDK
jgi:hypothetical protein